MDELRHYRHFVVTADHLCGAGNGELGSQLRRESVAARSVLGRVQSGDIGRRIFILTDGRAVSEEALRHNIGLPPCAG